MSAALIAAALALAASLPLAVLGWVAGVATERLTADPGRRERVWGLALHLPLLAVVAAVLGAALFPLMPEQVGPAVAGGTAGAMLWTETAPASTRPSVDRQLLASCVLAASALGAAVRFALGLAGARRIADAVRRARPLDRPDLANALRPVAARLGVRTEVRVSHEVSEPLLAGLRRPVVLLPAPLAASGAAETLALIGAHEFAHLRRRDNLRLLAEDVLLGAFWFNPLLPRIRGELRNAREQVCDALALEAEPPVARRLYGDALVQTLRLSAGPELQSTFTGARRRTAMRLHALLHPAAPPSTRQKIAVASLLAGLLAAAGGGAFALSGVAGEAAPAPKPRGGLHPTPEPVFLKHWDHAARRSGLRQAEDVYTGGLKLDGPPPASFPVLVDGKQAKPGEDLGAIGPVAAVQVRRTATQLGGPQPRILRVDVHTSGDDGAAQAPAASPPSAASRKSVQSYTSTITADEADGPANVAVTVRSDQFENRGGGRNVATGRVEVEASGAPAGLIEVDGRPQPAGFDPRTLQGRILRVEGRNTEGEGQPVYNLITR